MRKFTIKELTQMDDFSSIKQEELSGIMDTLMESRKGMAAIITTVLKAAASIYLIPIESLDKVIAKAESEDLRGSEEEYRDELIPLLKAVREIKPKLEVFNRLPLFHNEISKGR